MQKLICAYAVCFFATSVFAAETSGGNWPQFRGPNASGIAEGHPLPVKWDVEARENVKWKTPIAGLAHSSPIVWGDKLFVTTAVSGEPEPLLKVGLYGESPKHEENYTHEFRLLCLNKDTGAILWDKLVKRGIPRTQRHIKATQANPTPATNGEFVIAFFGSEGMACFDMDGNMKWYKDFGVIDSGPADAADLQWGFASSPVIHDGKLIVLVDARGESYLAAYEVATGKGLWRTMRPTYPGWHTPTVHVDAERAQVITNGYKRTGGYDLNTGKELWWLEGGGDVPVPTPVVADGLIYITSAHGAMAPLYAIKTSATGDINLKDQPAAAADTESAGKKEDAGGGNSPPLATGDGGGSDSGEKPADAGNPPPLPRGERGGSGSEGSESPGLIRRTEHIVWMHPRIGNYMQTPLVYNGLLYMCRDSGIMACYDAKTGEKKYRVRLASGVGFTASPVAGDSKIYFTSEEGDIFVIKTGPKYELLSKNSVGEIAMATPAISEGTMFWRTKGNVIAIAKNPKESRDSEGIEGRPADQRD